jgi:cytidylate kinase
VTRSIAPDATVVDTTGKSVEQVVAEVLAIIRQKLGSTYFRSL